MDKIICDASPLIVLAKADLLELLPNQFSEIVVPQAVVEEILKTGKVIYNADHAP